MEYCASYGYTVRCKTAVTLKHTQNLCSKIVNVMLLIFISYFGPNLNIGYHSAIVNSNAMAVSDLGSFRPPVATKQNV